jgi:glycerate kinase
MERYVVGGSEGSEDVRVTGPGALGRAFSRPCASEWERTIAVGGGGKADGGVGMASSIALTVRSSRRETVNVACGR